jgi:hypothetical protein
MSDKFYVVSESELQEYWLQGFRAGHDIGPRNTPEPRLARDACRARPLDPQYMPEGLFQALIGIKGYSLKNWLRVPEWATHFAKIREVWCSHGPTYPVEQSEEIKFWQQSRRTNDD